MDNVFSRMLRSAPIDIAWPAFFAKLSSQDVVFESFTAMSYDVILSLWLQNGQKISQH